MNTRVELITQAEYARRRGVAKSAVTKAVREKRIVLINGMIDPAVADIQWSQNTRARADSGRAAAPIAQDGVAPQPVEETPGSGPDSAPGASASPGYADYRAMREKADAEMAVRANLKDAGLLVERAQVQRGAFDVVRAFRDAVMVIGQRAAPRCIGLGDSREIEHVITEESRKALEGFEERMAALLPRKEAV